MDLDLLRYITQTVNTHIGDNNIDCPLLVLDQVIDIIEYRDQSIIDGISNLDTTIRLDRLGVLYIPDGYKQKLADIYYDGDKSRLGEPISEDKIEAYRQQKLEAYNKRRNGRS